MDLSAQFKEFLAAEASAPSFVTIKNYISDVNKFIKWFESKSDSTFDPAAVNKSSIEDYKKDSLETHTLSSVERSLSSLRKFFHFLKLEGYVSSSPFEGKEKELPDPWKIKDFKNHLYVFNASYLTIKNYVIDVKQFAGWAENVLPPSQDMEGKALDQVNSALLDEYKKRLMTDLGLSPISVNRKLSSLRRYLSWAKSEGLIRNEPIQTAARPAAQDLAALMSAYQDVYDTPGQLPSSESLFGKTKNIADSALDNTLVNPLAAAIDKAEYLFWILRGRPVFKKANADEFTSNVNRKFFAPAGTSNLPFYKKFAFGLVENKPNWYLTLDSMGIVRFSKFAGFVLLISIASFSLYSRVNPTHKEVLSVSSAPTAANRTFVGRLTDAFGSPITTTTSLRLALYNDKSASGSALLWQENVTVTPDQNGQFRVNLGKDSFLPTNIFTQNLGLWLGVTVGKTHEMAPRQKISTIDLSSDSERLGGLPLITESKETKNVVLALNSSGNMVIDGNASPTFQASGGTFTLAGNTLVLKTNTGSSGNIVLSPDGSGSVDIQKPVVNSLGNININDLVELVSTDSAQAALTINQLSKADILSASNSAGSVFLISNTGDILAKGTINKLQISDGKILAGSWRADTISPDYGGTGQSSYNQGDILYANSSNSLSKLNIGPSGACLISNGNAPTWGVCTVTNINQNTGDAAFVINQQGSGNIIAASSAGQPTFTVKNDGSVVLGESIAATGGNASGEGSPASINGLGDSGSLIPNSSFEIPDQNGIFAQGWKISATSSALVALDNSDAVHGERSALVNVSNNKAAFYSSCFPISGLTNNYNLQWYYRQNGVGAATVRAYLDQYTSKTNCNSNTSPTFSQAMESGSNNSWSMSSAVPNIAANSKWARVHFFVGCDSCSNSSVWIDGVRLVENSQTAGLDYAENYPADPSSVPQAGEVVSLTRIDGATFVKKADKYLDDKVLGVVSTKPGQVLDDGSVPSPKVAIALAGRVPVKVSTKNGVISQGDTLTSSDIPGVAVKAKNAGPTIGIAMEDYKEADQSKIGQIIMFVKTGYNSTGIFTGDKIEANSANIGALSAQDANVNGTLRAKELIADHLTLSDDTLATLSALFINNFANSPTTTLMDLTVANRLFVGPTLSLADNTINVLGSNLELQPLKMGGISFVGGQVKIDTDGNLRVGGNIVAEKDLQVLGKIVAETLSPADGKNIIVQLDDKDVPGNQFQVRASNSAVLSINNKGDIQSSGDATFKKLNVNESTQYKIVSDTEIVANGAAGVAEIKDGETTLTIDNPLITENSLIYVTPRIPDATLYIVKQTPNQSFTVGLSQILGKNVPFNWIIVN